MKKWVVLPVLVLAVVTGCGINLHPTADKWFALHSFIMQDFEKTVYKDLAVTDKGRFQTMFWEARTSEARQEFQNRLEYVKIFLKDENPSQPWNSDRSRVLLLNGFPLHISEFRSPDASTDPGHYPISGKEFFNVYALAEDITATTAIRWKYLSNKQTINYIFQHVPPREYKLLRIGQFEKDFEQFNKDTMYQIVDEEKYALELKSLKKLK